MLGQGEEATTQPGPARTVEMTVFERADFAGTPEFEEVQAVARRLLLELNRAAVLLAIEAADQPGQSSAFVQGTFLSHATALGFASEKTGLFASYENSALRPDYYLAVGNTGILLEVERGKTTTNNMDLLDFWKCHICQHADYLFLLVPKALRHNQTMTPKKEYLAVTKRLSAFFVPGNYTNVRGLFVFGY